MDEATRIKSYLEEGMNLFQVTLAVCAGRRQWYSGEVVRLAGNSRRYAYLKNEGGLVRLQVSDRPDQALTVAWLDLAAGVWKLSPQFTRPAYDRWVAVVRSQ